MFFSDPTLASVQMLSHLALSLLSFETQTSCLDTGLSSHHSLENPQSGHKPIPLCLLRGPRVCKHFYFSYCTFLIVPEENTGPSAAMNDKKLNWKSAVSEMAKSLCRVRDSTDAFPLTQVHRQRSVLYSGKL